MPSCLRLKPGPDVAVIVLAPVAADPITMLMASSSLDACRNALNSGYSGFLKYWARVSGTSLDGVIGYAK